MHTDTYVNSKLLLRNDCDELSFYEEIWNPSHSFFPNSLLNTCVLHLIGSELEVLCCLHSWRPLCNLLFSGRAGGHMFVYVFCVHMKECVNVCLHAYMNMCS